MKKTIRYRHENFIKEKKVFRKSISRKKNDQEKDFQTEKIIDQENKKKQFWPRIFYTEKYFRNRVSKIKKID